LHLQLFISSIKKEMRIPISVLPSYAQLHPKDLKKCFGDQNLIFQKKHPQTNLFLAIQQLTIKWPQGQQKNINILGPSAKTTQIFLTQTDAKTLWIQFSNNKSPQSLLIIGPHWNHYALDTTKIFETTYQISKADAQESHLKQNQIITYNIPYKNNQTFQAKIHIKDYFSPQILVPFDKAQKLWISTHDRAQITKKIRTDTIHRVL